MKHTLFLFIYLGILTASYGQKSKESNQEIKQIIVEKYEQMRITLKNGDPNYVLNMHSKDAILFLPNGKEITGINELKPFYESVAKTGIDIKSSPTSVEQLAGDIVYEVGIFTSTSKTGTQNTAKYINIWKKIDGDWRIYKAIDQAKL